MENPSMTDMDQGDGSTTINNQMMMMGPMHMYVYFSSTCAFVFKQWRTNAPNDDGLFALGCILSLVYAVFHTFIPFMKERYMKSVAHKLGKNEKCPLSVRMVLAVFYFSYALSNIILMMIMMTMNGYVLLALAVGLTLGYGIFSSPKAAAAITSKAHSCH